MFIEMWIHKCKFFARVVETSPEFQTLGSRGHNGQSSVSFLDPKSGVLFYALTNMNAIACWRPQQKFTTQQQDYVYQDNVTMIFPNDLKVYLQTCIDDLFIFRFSTVVIFSSICFCIFASCLHWQIDRNGNLWVLSDRLPIFMYSHLDLQDFNFRILVGSTEELIMGTVCAMNLSPIYSTTMMHDHRDHMGHMDHTGHMSTTPRITARFNSASSIKIEPVFLMMLLSCLIKTFM